jgi:hypothetical protein
MSTFEQRFRAGKGTDYAVDKDPRYLLAVKKDAEKRKKEAAEARAAEAKAKAAAAERVSAEKAEAISQLRAIESGVSPELAAFAAESAQIESETGVPGSLISDEALAELKAQRAGVPATQEPAIPATEKKPAEAKDKAPAEQPPSTTDEIMDGLERIRLLRTEAAQADARAFEALQERQRLEAQRVQDEINSAEEDLKSYSIDPNRAYKSLGSQIAAAFAIALGAFAQGFTGGRTPNTALKIIEGAIARDVEAQKSEMMKRKDVLKNKNNVYARMLSRFGNEVAAEKATTVLGLRSAVMQTQALIEKYPSMVNKKVGLEAIARMEEARIKTLVDLQKTQGRALRGEGKKADTLRLFEQADASVKKLEGIFLEVADEVEGFMGTFGLAVGEFGKAVGLGDVFQSNIQGLYDAQVSNAAQSINKAFSGARGSDRDLAAVLMQMPTLKIFFGKNGKERGLARIKQIQGNLKDAIRAQGGQLLEDDQYANYAVAQSLTGRDGKKITDEDIESFMESDEFIKIRNKLYGEESAEKKSPN